MRVYLKTDSCIFKKNNEAFGELSNMATVFPLQINDQEIKTTEALYQSCKYPSYPEIQMEICLVKSPMTAKMIARSHPRKMREDWDEVKVKIMRWCLKIKLAQHFITFGHALALTGNKSIVENSSKDNFWGAIPNENKTEFVGINALGRLLMELRDEVYASSINSLLIVKPPAGVENFKLFGEKLKVQDERESFNQNFLSYFNSRRKKSQLIGLNIFGSLILDIVHNSSMTTVQDAKKKGNRPKTKISKPRFVTLF